LKKRVKKIKREKKIKRDTASPQKNGDTFFLRDGQVFYQRKKVLISYKD
jgi:hypothetical protein